MADYSVKCWEGHHMQTALVMAFCGIVYIIGIPLCCVFILFKNRQLVTDSALADSDRGKSFRGTYGSLFASYNKHHWYFESVEMIKKMTLAGGLVLVAPGSSVQILVGILVAFSYLLVVQQYRPYKNTNDTNLQAFASTQVVLTLLAGLVMKTDTTGVYEEGIMGILLIIMNGSVLLIGLFAIFISCTCNCCCKKKNGSIDDERICEKDEDAAAEPRKKMKKSGSKDTTKVVPVPSPPASNVLPIQENEDDDDLKDFASSSDEELEDLSDFAGDNTKIKATTNLNKNGEEHINKAKTNESRPPDKLKTQMSRKKSFVITDAAQEL